MNGHQRARLFLNTAALFVDTAAPFVNTTALFFEVTSGPFAAGNQDSHGGVAVDVDMNGAPDLYVVNYGEPNQLFVTEKKGGFVEATNGPATNGSKRSSGGVVEDFDLNGAPDLYVVNSRGPHSSKSSEPNQMFLNDKKGGFTEVTGGELLRQANSKYAGDEMWRSGRWEGWVLDRHNVTLDANGDGRPDSYVVNYKRRNQLFLRNDTEVTSGPGKYSGPGSKRWRSAVALDANGDGWDDLYCTIESEPNHLLLNARSKMGGFVDRNGGPAVTGGKDSIGSLVLDANGDGAQE